jgi:hypothetical protein
VLNGLEGSHLVARRVRYDAGGALRQIGPLEIASTDPEDARLASAMVDRDITEPLVRLRTVRLGPKQVRALARVRIDGHKALLAVRHEHSAIGRVMNDIAWIPEIGTGACTGVRDNTVLTGVQIQLQQSAQAGIQQQKTVVGHVQGQVLE